MKMALARDPARAAPMQAYMKTEQSFYGIQAKERRAIFKECTAMCPVVEQSDYEDVIRTLWDGEHREDMYQALETAEYFKQFRTAKSWRLYEELVHSATNWDTLDWIAGKLVSDLLLRERARFAKRLLVWRKDDNLWVRRASLLAHLHHGKETDRELLGETIRLLMPEKDFFIRKAIGWILRDFANTDPLWVIEFTRQVEQELSGLSRREALKHVGDGDDL